MSGIQKKFIKYLLINSLFVALFLPACKNKTLGVPVIYFPVKEKMLGNVKAENIHVSFEFINRGTAPLKISNVTSDCHCTIPTWDTSRILPHDISSIKLVFVPNSPGPIEQALTVYSNGGAFPETLIFRAVVIK